MSAPSPVRFARIDPESDREIAELSRQRILCGWGLENVDHWRQLIREDRRNMYWIFPTDPAVTAALPDDEPLSLEAGKIGPPPPDPSFRPLGHVAVDWEDYDGEPTLASKDDRVCTLATFFILKSQQGKGLGSFVMKEMERQAVSELNARAITLNTVDGDRAADPAWWARIGVDAKAEVTRNNERWYERYGYVAYRRGVPRYPHKTPSGEDILLEAVFMRKELQP
ncbi:hypothetical protein JCM8097_003385 [Rhodosporidiobolus ruineniae]